MPKTGKWLLAFTLLTLALWPLGSARALQQYYGQDQVRNPGATKWTPKRFGYVQSQHVLPGTAKQKPKKCIPNGQARCIPRPARPDPFGLRDNVANNLPHTRSGMTASPTVKTFEYDYPEEN